MLEYRIFKELDDATVSGRDCALATVIANEGSTPRESGAKMIVFADGSTKGTVGGGKLEALCIQAALEAIKTGASLKKVFELTPEGIGMVCAGKNEVFIEPFVSRLDILILGAGHVGQKIAEVAAAAGISHSVADDRDDFANRERFPAAAHVYAERPDAAASRAGEKTFVVIVTRGHSLDQECLEAALATKARYIGMIGSKNKVPLVFKNLNAKKLHPETDPRVYAPIGLDLGGKAPGEIAVSVVAQILRLADGKSGRHLGIGKEN